MQSYTFPRTHVPDHLPRLRGAAVMMSHATDVATMSQALRKIERVLWLDMTGPRRALAWRRHNASPIRLRLESWQMRDLYVLASDVCATLSRMASDLTDQEYWHLVDLVDRCRAILGRDGQSGPAPARMAASAMEDR